MDFGEFLFRNCLEIPDGAHTGTSMSRQERQRGLGLQPRVGEKYGLDATLTIVQTVSPGTRVNRDVHLRSDESSDSEACGPCLKVFGRFLTLIAPRNLLSLLSVTPCSWRSSSILAERYKLNPK